MWNRRYILNWLVFHGFSIVMLVFSGVRLIFWTCLLLLQGLLGAFVCRKVVYSFGLMENSLRFWIEGKIPTDVVSFFDLFKASLQKQT